MTFSIYDIRHKKVYNYGECRYAECRYAECRGAKMLFVIIGIDSVELELSFTTITTPITTAATTGPYFIKVFVASSY
jgi:hypothetical protein